MHFTREEKHGLSANSVTEHSLFFFFFCSSMRRRRGKGFDERQEEDVRMYYLFLGLC